MNATLCLCSRGWVKTIFETLLGKPVRVELEKAIGRGDDICRYVVQT
jgi:predicted hydrocarbon binding protein